MQSCAQAENGNKQTSCDGNCVFSDDDFRPQAEQLDRNQLLELNHARQHTPE
jgi:hypothetical protein